MENIKIERFEGKTAFILQQEVIVSILETSVI